MELELTELNYSFTSGKVVGAKITLSANTPTGEYANNIIILDETELGDKTPEVIEKNARAKLIDYINGVEAEPEDNASPDTKVDTPKDE